jgi:alpha-tubulin suppressor-like RCC1 family protein
VTKGTEGFRTDFFQPVSGFPRLPFIQMAASKEGGVTLAAEGSVWCWGNNTCGQLGDPKMPMGNLREDKRALPVRVQFPTFSPMVRIGAGKETHFAIAADGRIWQWGQCRTADGATSTPVPMQVPGVCLKTVDEARQRQLQDEIIVFEENRKKAVAQKEQARLGQQRKQQEAIWLKKYDLNGNGQLDPEERQRAEADAKARIVAPAQDE